MLRKKYPGDKRPSAGEHNQMVDGVNRALQENWTSTPDSKQRFKQWGTVKVFNQTGANLPTRSVVGLAGPVFSPQGAAPVFTNNEQGTIQFLNTPTFSALIPTDDHVDRIAILQQPLRNEIVGDALLSGVTACLVKFTKGSFTVSPSVRRARVATGSTSYLQADECGPIKILWAETNENEIKRCLVQLDADPPTGVFSVRHGVGWTSGSVPDGGRLITLFTGSGGDAHGPLHLTPSGSSYPPLEFDYGGIAEVVNNTTFRLLRRGFYRTTLSIEMWGEGFGGPYSPETKVVSISLANTSGTRVGERFVNEYTRGGFSSWSGSQVFHVEPNVELCVDVFRAVGTQPEAGTVTLSVELLG